MRKSRTAALIVPFAAAGLLLAPSPALAHDVLIDSDPEDGATLDALPEEVVLTFNNSPLESGEGNAIVVTGPDGETTYEEGGLDFDGPDVSVGLAPLDEEGEYSIGYRVVSSDGHPIQDTLTFTVTEEAVAEAAPDEEEEADEEEAAEDEAAAEESIDESPASAEDTAADEAGTSPIMVLAGVIAAIAAIGAVVLVIVRMRNRPGAPSGEGSAQ